MVKNLPAMWETWVQSLGWEDPLEKGMAADSSILACRIPMGRGAWWATGSMHHKVLDTTEQLSTASVLQEQEGCLDLCHRVGTQPSPLPGACVSASMCGSVPEDEFIPPSSAFVPSFVDIFIQ